MYDFFATASHMSWFEIGMLVCFAASWPVSIYKTWKLKLGKEKSRTFILLVAVGYVCGICHKIRNNADVVILLYAFNLALVLADLVLVLYHRSRQKAEESRRT